MSLRTCPTSDADDSTFIRGENGSSRDWAVSKKLFEAAVVKAEGSPLQKNLALNGLAVVKIRSKDYEGAVKDLRRIELNEENKTNRSFYRYNLARALELKGDPSGAFGSYLESVKARPDFKGASASAFRVLLERQNERRRRAPFGRRVPASGDEG